MIFDVLVKTLPVFCHLHQQQCITAQYQEGSGSRVCKVTANYWKTLNTEFQSNKTRYSRYIILRSGKDSYHSGNNNKRPEPAAFLDKRPKQTHIVASITKSAGGVDVHSSACWSVEAHLELRLCLLHVIRQHPTAEGLEGDGGTVMIFISLAWLCASLGRSPGDGEW